VWIHGGFGLHHQFDVKESTTMLSNRSRLIVPAILGLTSALAGGARADFLPIVNAGFEEPLLSDGSFTFTIPGWTGSERSGVFNPGAGQYPGGVPEGQNVAFTEDDDDFVSQVLSSTLAADTTYTLMMFVGNRLDFGFPGYLIELRAGGVLLAQDANTLAPADGQFLLSTISFTSTAASPGLGQALEVRFLSGSQANFDDVRLDATATVRAVPEPGSLALLGGGSLALLGHARRRKHTSKAA
jgi:hypothetical protein